MTGGSTSIGTSDYERLVIGRSERRASHPVSSVCYVENHQQYLAKNPHGYRCHANTGVKLPDTP
jgi:hypothetical protein